MGDIPIGDVLVLNQTNALNLTPYCRERKLLSQGNLWHKIIIHNVATLDREEVLKVLLNTVHPLDLIPVNYKIEGQNAHFIARNCGAAIEKLCRDNLVVQNSTGQPFILTIVLAFSNTSETQLNVQTNISDAIRKRFDSKTGTIDLDCFHKDPALSDLIFCVLSQPKILHFVLQLCRPFNAKILKLGNNELRTVNPLEVLWTCKNLSHLDLRNNLIENMVSLSSLKSMQIKELWLDGNPVCQNYDEAGYLQAVREVCPTVTKLDGVLLGTEGFLAYRRNFAVLHTAESFVDQFLEHYFTLYDSKDRKLLQSIYHPQALFSLSTSYIAGQITSFTTRLESYKKLSRNLSKLSDFSKTCEQLELGPEKIVQKLCNLPATEHDPYTFTVDVLQYSEAKVVLIVTGAFREPVHNLQDVECVYCFSRTFVLVARDNGEYNIVNEMLHISNSTTILANRAFKNVRVARPRSSVTLKSAETESERNEFIFALGRITSMNWQWCKKCLEQAKWNLKRALEIFVEFYKLDKIPQDSFVSQPIERAVMMPVPAPVVAPVQVLPPAPPVIVPPPSPVPVPVPAPVPAPMPVPAPVQPPVQPKVQPMVQPSTQKPNQKPAQKPNQKPAQKPNKNPPQKPIQILKPAVKVVAPNSNQNKIVHPGIFTDMPKGYDKDAWVKLSKAQRRKLRREERESQLKKQNEAQKAKN